MENIKIKEEIFDLHEVLDIKPDLELFDVDLRMKVELGDNIAFENFDWSIQNCKKECSHGNNVICYKELIKSSPQRCLRCNHDFDNRYSFIKHNLRYLSIKLDPLDDHQQVRHRQKHKKHNNNYLVSKSFHKHMRSVHNENIKSQKFKCHECHMTYRCRKYLRQHITNIHRANGEFKCDLCPTVLRTKDKYNKHMKNVHSDGVFKCQICNSQLKSEPYLRTHMQRVHYNDGKKHKCYCGKSFKSPRYLNRHKKNMKHL